VIDNVKESLMGDLPFDRQAPAGSGLDALNLEYFKESYLPAAVSAEVLRENRREIDEQLRALHLLSATGTPSFGALLLLGRDARSWLPGAYVQFVRFDGTDLGAPILDQKEIVGRLADILLRLDEMARINIRIATQVEGTTVEQRLPDYPQAALQQLLRNAVLHRTYEVHAPVYWYWFTDRVEIHSPGGLYGRVTPESFGEPGATDYRNPTLAEGLKILGFVQRFGMGIDLARRRCAENGNPEPEFKFSSAAVLVTIRRPS
jgi:ATP-dependent DNA helicase RecG